MPFHCGSPLQISTLKISTESFNRETHLPITLVDVDVGTLVGSLSESDASLPGVLSHGRVDRAPLL